MTSEAIQWFRNGDHPADGVGEPRLDWLTGITYPAVEGAVVRYFRHPDRPGDVTHKWCGRVWDEHGWIDSGGDGETVCPGDWVTTALPAHVVLGEER